MLGSVEQQRRVEIPRDAVQAALDGIVVVVEAVLVVVIVVDVGGGGGRRERVLERLSHQQGAVEAGGRLRRHPHRHRGGDAALGRADRHGRRRHRHARLGGALVGTLDADVRIAAVRRRALAPATRKVHFEQTHIKSSSDHLHDFIFIYKICT